MTNSSSKLTSLFSWNKTREMAPRSCFLDLDITASPGKGDDLAHFDDHLSYTSLRDLLPTSRPGSPGKQTRPSEEKSDEDDPMKMERLPIKNRLVEQAARAYLLPVSPQKTPPDQFFTRYWARLTVPRAGCIHGCTHGCLSCLPTLLWVDLTRVVHALFGQLRPPALISDRAHPKALTAPPSLVTPSLVK